MISQSPSNTKPGHNNKKRRQVCMYNFILMFQLSQAHKKDFAFCAATTFYERIVHKGCSWVYILL